MVKGNTLWIYSINKREYMLPATDWRYTLGARLVACKQSKQAPGMQ
jgi:hypothetical protein